MSWTITTSEARQNLNIPEKERIGARTSPMRRVEATGQGVGGAREMVREGVGSARGRPQAGRTSRRERRTPRLGGMPRGRESDREKLDFVHGEDEEEEEDEEGRKEEKEEKGKINDGEREREGVGRGEKTVEKGKTRKVPLYPRMGKDVTKRKERWGAGGREREARERVESWIPSRLGIKGVLYDAVVYGRGFYLIALPPVRISQ